MRSFYALLLAFLTFPVIIKAQSKFSPGYIVNMKGDTLKGFVDQKEWGENPNKISFKQNLQANTERYTPADIKAFGVVGQDQFITYNGPITKGAVDLADLSSGIDSSTVQSSIFLRMVGKGKNLTLYTYWDRTKDRFFIAVGSTVPFELIRYVFLDIKHSDKIVELNNYQQQLAKLATVYQPGNNALIMRILTTPYKLNDLQKIVTAIDGLQATQTTFSVKRSGHRFFIGAGVNLTKATFLTVWGNNMFSSTDHASSTGPLVSGGIDFYFNKNVEKFLFRTEVNLATNKIKATYSNTYSDYINETRHDDELTVDQIAAVVNPQLIYNVYNKEKLKFYIAGGLQTTFSSFSNNHYVIKSYYNNRFDESKERPLVYRKITTNLTAKVGVAANKIEVYLGYCSRVMLTEYPYFGMDVTTYRLGLNYLFGKK